MMMGININILNIPIFLKKNNIESLFKNPQLFFIKHQKIFSPQRFQTKINFRFFKIKLSFLTKKITPKKLQKIGLLKKFFLKIYLLVILLYTLQ